MKNKGEILAAILKNYNDCCFFLHNTRNLDAVESIMKDGFVFENQLLHSSDRVNPNEPVEVSYFLIHRKDYGFYTVIIAIPKTVYENYIKVSQGKDIGIEEVMSISKPYYGDNDELMYTISPKHILGYFNLKTSEFYKNNHWDPLFNT